MWLNKCKSIDIYQLANNSCQEVPANTEIILKIYDGSNLVKEIQEITKSPIFGGRRILPYIIYDGTTRLFL